ncbi:MAG: hypothetical protein LBJ95_05105 [Oscillospiraceae bacterium]|nr:hypothetical protein [Oscillospiraceae bacterium]
MTNADGELWRSICQCKLNDAQNMGSHIADNIVTHEGLFDRYYDWGD